MVPPARGATITPLGWVALVGFAVQLRSGASRREGGLVKVIVTRHNAPEAPPRAAGNENNVQGAPPDPPPEAVAAPPDDYTARLLALIPTEVTALFVALIAAVATAPDATAKYAPAVLLPIGAILTVLHLRRMGQTQRPPVEPLRRQYVLSVLAFLAWGASIADPLEAWDLAIPKWILISAIMLIPAVGAALFDDA